MCDLAMKMKCGLNDQDIEYIVTAIARFPEISKAVLFGSRAKGNYKCSSDIDIAIMGDGVAFSTVARLRSLLQDEGPLPYLFDIVDYTHLQHKDLREHIDRVGIVFYEQVKNEGSA